MRPWLLLALCSCDKLLGLHTVGPPVDGGDPADDKGHVSGTYVSRWYELGVSGAAQLQERGIPEADLSGSVTLADGSFRPITFGDGTFDFTTVAPGDPYSLQISNKTGKRMWNLATTSPQLVDRTSYPPDRMLAPVQTKLDLNFTARHSTGTNTKEEIVTLGTFARRQIATADPLELDCASTDAFGVQVGLLGGHDAVLYTSTVLGMPDTSYFRIGFADKVNDVVTPPGVTTTAPTLPNAIQPVAFDQCTTLSVELDAESGRIQPLVPGATASPHAWYINADPGIDQALSDGLPIAFGGSENPTNVTYGNPYAPILGTHAELYAFAQNADNAILASQTVVPIPTGCAGPLAIAAGLVELPTNVALDGAPLASTQQIVAVPSAGSLALTWDRSSDGAADLYIVLVLLTTDGIRATTIDNIVTNERRVNIPVKDFQAGSTYMIKVVTAVGYPNAAQGDYRAVATTIGNALYQTPVFRVTSQ